MINLIIFDLHDIWEIIFNEFQILYNSLSLQISSYLKCELPGFWSSGQHSSASIQLSTSPLTGLLLSNTRWPYLGKEGTGATSPSVSTPVAVSHFCSSTVHLWLGLHYAAQHGTQGSKKALCRQTSVSSFLTCHSASPSADTSSDTKDLVQIAQAKVTDRLKEAAGMG